MSPLHSQTPLSISPALAWKFYTESEHFLTPQGYSITKPKLST